MSEITIDTIVSGGISSLDDLRNLKALEKQTIIGVIVGRALYDVKITLKEANKI